MGMIDRGSNTDFSETAARRQEIELTRILRSRQLEHPLEGLPQ